MESTGNYHAPGHAAPRRGPLCLGSLCAIIVHDYGNNSSKTGQNRQKDARKAGQATVLTTAHIAETCPGGYPTHAENLLLAVPTVFESSDVLKK